MAKSKLKVYHKTNCSKSRCALEWLDEHDHQYEVIEYLKQVPTKKELQQLLAKLDMKPLDLIRKKEEIFIKKFKNKKFTDDEWIQIIIENPNLIERPIVVDGYKAIIARPAELLEEFLNRKKK